MCTLLYNRCSSCGTSTPTRLRSSFQVNAVTVAFIKAYLSAIELKTYYNTTYIGVIDLDAGERQTTIVGLDELNLSEWRTSFITQLVEVAMTGGLDDFLAKSVADLASLLDRQQESEKKSVSKFGDLLLFWSYCLHRCVRVCVCVCVCVRLVAS